MNKIQITLTVRSLANLAALCRHSSKRFTIPELRDEYKFRAETYIDAAKILWNHAKIIENVQNNY